MRRNPPTLAAAFGFMSPVPSERRGAISGAPVGPGEATNATAERRTVRPR